MKRELHRIKAEENRRFLTEVDEGKWPQWAVTVAFYAALHTIDQLLVEEGLHTGKHVVRNTSIKDSHPRVWVSYDPLYRAACSARYDGPRHFATTYPAAVIRSMIDVHLPAVERYVASALQAIDDAEGT